MSNERLRQALARAHVDVPSVSRSVGVDPKTVERWVSTGRRPHRHHQHKVAELLDADVDHLWPPPSTRSLTLQSSQFVEFYSTRGAVPQATWRQLISGSRASISVLAFAASFLSDTIPDLVQLLHESASSDVRVRLLLGDPESSAVALRGEEEGIGDLLAARCRLSWNYLDSLLDTAGIEARAHGATLYASLFIFDDEAMINHHLFGLPANRAPVLRLRRADSTASFWEYEQMFERVWNVARERKPER